MTSLLLRYRCSSSCGGPRLNAVNQDEPIDSIFKSQQCRHLEWFFPGALSYQCFCGATAFGTGERVLRGGTLWASVYERRESYASLLGFFC